MTVVKRNKAQGKMKMRLRAFLLLTLFFVPVILTAISLGIWQSHRAEWKTGLLEQIRISAVRQKTDLQTAIALEGQDQYTIAPIRLSGTFMFEPVFYRPGGKGYNIILPFKTCLLYTSPSPRDS